MGERYLLVHHGAGVGDVPDSAERTEEATTRRVSAWRRRRKKRACEAGCGLKQAGSMPGECRKPWLLSICSFAHLLPSRPAFLKQEWSLRVGYTLLRCGFGIPCLRCVKAWKASNPDAFFGHVGAV